MTTMCDLAFLLAGLVIGVWIRRHVPVYTVKWIGVDDMGWDYEDYENKKAAFMALREEDAFKLNWGQAHVFVPSDTLAMAIWRGERERGEVEPWQALCRIFNLEPSPPGERPSTNT